MKVKILYIKDLGQVDFVKNQRSKHLRIIIKSGGKVKVTLPVGCSYNLAEKFVMREVRRIKAHLEKINSKKFFLDEASDFRTKNYQLKILGHSSDICKHRIKEDIIEFYYPENTAVTDLQTQNKIKTLLIEVMRKEAKAYLPAKVREIANKFSFSYKKVFVKNLKTRWGSCSSIDNINLNLHLMRIPEHLADYVILHELAHTKEKNHGKNFWKLLDSLAANSKQLNKELKKYSIEL